MKDKINNKDSLIERSSGILLPVFSLPSKESIGTFGKGAYDFIDFLEKSNQKFWQVLPLNIPDKYNSPYSSKSSYAGNYMFIDLYSLKNKKIINRLDFIKESNRVDYRKAREKRRILKESFYKGFNFYENKIYEFYNKNKSWLKDYSLFTILSRKNKYKTFLHYREKKREVILKDLGKEFDYYLYEQYLFYNQWNKLKNYANQKGINIIGDLPFYCGKNSSDFWANKNNFIAPMKFYSTGVPPDGFSNKGQVWNLPPYNWEEIEKNNFSWWINRIKHQLEIFDVLRLDHFRGFQAYWIFYNKNPLKGKWLHGPGERFINSLNSEIDKNRIIAEDLGDLNSEVIELLEKSTYFGMNVLQFAFDEEDSKYLPHKHNENSVCYIGTHDNSTLKTWIDKLDENTRSRILKYYNIKEEEISKSIINSAFNSPAKLAIFQLQDFLGLDEKSRINSPGTIKDNWNWRIKSTQLRESLSDLISAYTKRHGRKR